jgi:hypothetical protein
MGTVWDTAYGAAATANDRYQKAMMGPGGKKVDPDLAHGFAALSAAFAAAMKPLSEADFQDDTKRGDIKARLIGMGEMLRKIEAQAKAGMPATAPGSPAKGSAKGKPATGAGKAAEPSTGGWLAKVPPWARWVAAGLALGGGVAWLKAGETPPKLGGQ